ncbi:hypothetical protein [Syntrophus sp. (in: bacteria)]|uniref:hypothetical protein n=1 Tax=Syntrophus sp. (in: bacteria) TaxID=48412 RepID=UPI00345EF649
MPLIFAPESGEAMIGSQRVHFVPAGDDGSIRVVGRSGSVIRPLRFGERTRLLIDALLADDPPGFCADLLVHAATDSPAEALSPDERALALVLAGGDIDAPTLSRTVAAVSAATGWPEEAINEKRAIEIDRMAYDLSSRDAGWKRIVFPRQGADDVETIILELASLLLNRTDDAMMRLREDVLSRPTEAEGEAWGLLNPARKAPVVPAGLVPAEPPWIPQGSAGSFPGRTPAFSKDPAALSGRRLPGSTNTMNDPSVPRFPESDPAAVSSPGMPLSAGSDPAASRNGTPVQLREQPLSCDPSAAPPSAGRSGRWDAHPDRIRPRGLPASEENSERNGGERRSRAVAPIEAGERSPGRSPSQDPPFRRPSGLSVQRTENKPFKEDLQPGWTSASGLMDSRAPELTGPGPSYQEARSEQEARLAPMRGSLPAGHHTGRTPAGFSSPEGRIQGFYPSCDHQRLSPVPAGEFPGLSAHSSSARAYADVERDILSSLDDLDLAELADGIGRLLSAEADLRGID